jgi:hypothetical protein
MAPGFIVLTGLEQCIHKEIVKDLSLFVKRLRLELVVGGKNEVFINTNNAFSRVMWWLYRANFFLL